MKDHFIDTFRYSGVSGGCFMAVQACLDDKDVPIEAQIKLSNGCQRKILTLGPLARFGIPLLLRMKDLEEMICFLNKLLRVTD